jgi:hypothetical protein
MKIFLGQKVKHKDAYNGKEVFEVVGIRKTEVELQGDWSGGTHNTIGASWMPIKGLIYQNIWGHWIDEETEIDFTKNAGPRDL